MAELIYKEERTVEYLNKKLWLHYDKKDTTPLAQAAQLQNLELIDFQEIQDRL